MTATVSWILLLLLGMVIKSEVEAVLPRLHRWLIRRAASRLPASDRARWEEEWLGELQDQKLGILSSLAFSLHLFLLSGRMKRALSPRPTLVTDKLVVPNFILSGLILAYANAIKGALQKRGAEPAFVAKYKVGAAHYINAYRGVEMDPRLTPRQLRRIRFWVYVMRWYASYRERFVRN